MENLFKRFGNGKPFLNIWKWKTILKHLEVETILKDLEMEKPKDGSGFLG